ncbi:endonuclease [Paenibacillus sp. FSL P4-0081]|uniref:YraN family protein n=1 Tax=Paenibacillus TaxID=44249 RepID=UPI0004F8CB63|nr:YraN family protein [Paenibacillus sp. FSL P4-0081]AIQ30534.1 endonuclease [Paenibacillus sp. FSL P4-0081]
MSHGADRTNYTRRQKGAAAEQAASLYLSSRGYIIRECNWRCRSGELDIIAEYEDGIVFIEVRSRSGAGVQGTPEESVDERKIRQVRNTAQVYLHMRGLNNPVISFDVIAVQLNRDLSIASLRHIREAF